MAIPSRSYQSESWNEYKRLVLAELERLNDCVEKLRERHDAITLEHEKELSNKIAELSKNVMTRINELDHQIQSLNSGVNIELINEMPNRIKKLENDALTNEALESRKSKVTLWTAIITIVCSLIASIVSLTLQLF